MNRKTRIILPLVWVCTIVATPLFAATTDETEPFRGITHIQRTDWPEIPRAVFANILIVDLQDSEVSFRVTEPYQVSGEDPEQQYTRRERTLDYLERVEAQVAVNAHFYETVGSLARLRFLAVSDGVPYSKIEGAEPALNILFRSGRGNLARIVTRDPDAEPPTYETAQEVALGNAVGGNLRLVLDGRNTAGHNPDDPFFNPRARTAAGLTEDRENLVILVVEEGRTGRSEGVTPAEAADMLIEYGVRDGLNFDGGGSTNLAMAAPEPELVAGTGTRVVGSNLAVFAAPAPGVADFETWRERHFTEEELADPSVSGERADPAGDGVANLVKYVLGVPPMEPIDSGRRPEVAIETFTVDGDTGRYMTLTFTRRSGRDDVAVDVETSEDLFEWSGDVVLVAEDEDLEAGTETLTYRTSEPVEEGAQRFLRLRVARP